MPVDLMSRSRSPTPDTPAFRVSRHRDEAAWRVLRSPQETTIPPGPKRSSSRADASADVYVRCGNCCGAARYGMKRSTLRNLRGGQRDPGIRFASSVSGARSAALHDIAGEFIDVRCGVAPPPFDEPERPDRGERQNEDGCARQGCLKGCGHGVLRITASIAGLKARPLRASSN